MSEKERADIALVRRGLAVSREKAQAMIMAGEVYIGERKIGKASDTVRPEDTFTLRGDADKYVSRGAHKLEKAVRVFGADLNGRIIMDIGASTGGFTDVCLRNGAKHVYAIDVGYGQLDWKLRNDPRVTVMERTNARYLTPEMFAERPEIAVMDVSFISIRLILSAAFCVMGELGRMFTLIKPQFEAGRERIGKNGVVRDPETHRDVLNSIVAFTEKMGWRTVRLDYSPITGPKGNIEFLAEIRKDSGQQDAVTPDIVDSVVEDAHRKMTNSQMNG